jgi:hypothetical protein
MIKRTTIEDVTKEREVSVEVTYEALTKKGDDKLKKMFFYFDVESSFPTIFAKVTALCKKEGMTFAISCIKLTDRHDQTKV